MYVDFYIFLFISSNQTENDILVRDMLEDLASRHPTRFKVTCLHVYVYLCKFMYLDVFIFLFLYANQTENDILVRDMLHDLASRHPSRFKVTCLHFHVYI